MRRAQWTSLLLAAACAVSALLAGCRAETFPPECGQFVDAGCAADQYCSCVAGQVSVDERLFPGCAPVADAGDPQILLNPGGAPGECVPCSQFARCPGGHWDTNVCACVPN